MIGTGGDLKKFTIKNYDPHDLVQWSSQISPRLKVKGYSSKVLILVFWLKKCMPNNIWKYHSIACFLFFFSPALLRLLILLLLLMNGNVHPNPGPIFPCSVCAGNVTWQGKSVQCCACSKWVHLRCSRLSLSKFRALDRSHS